ncbi:hypothetical protein [Nitratireductor soli]|uniref:hypothetical protein n=1 Tax=Nitratireductor soli TaxID=1670619 RepID=UPI00065E7CD2|nr:hypothetical protein [Nitratireductor soli]
MTMIEEIGARILATLEETWADNVFTLINTVYEPPSSADLEEYCNAIRMLHQKGIVRFSWRILKAGKSPAMSEAETAEFLRLMESWFVLGGDGNWTCGRGDIRTMDIPRLFIREAGARIAEKLVDERGTEWWTQRSKTFDKIGDIVLAEWNLALPADLSRIGRPFYDQVERLYGALEGGFPVDRLEDYLYGAEEALPGLMPNEERIARLAERLLLVEIPEDRWKRHSA